MTTEPLDARETRPPQEREAALMAALGRQVAHAQRHAPGFAASLAGIDAAAIASRAALARLPVLRKHELIEAQRERREADVFGGFAAVGWGVRGGARKVFQSPGTLYEPEGAAPDYWRIARAMRAAGFRAGDLVHNSFSYHLTPAGSMMEGGALALGCTVFPAGVGQTELQLQAIAELRPAAYAGTPSFLKILSDRAEAAGQRLSPTKALVSAEPFPASLRDALSARGIEAMQCYATADVGLIAYETAAREGLVVDEDVIVEIVRPGTGETVADGEVGELVVTTLNPDYPLIRFGTGDLSAVLPGPCPSGRTNQRIRGWLGRADQTTKVRGMFVQPGHVAAAIARHPEVLRARLVVSGEVGSDVMTLHAEVAGAPDGLAARLVDAMREITKLRAEVALVAPGSLPNDGKMIEDARTHA